VPALEGGDAFRCGAGCGDGGDGGDAVEDAGAADGFFVEPGVGTLGRIDDELDFFAFDQVDDVGAAFFDFEDAIYREAGPLQRVGGAMGGYQGEAEVHEAAGDLGYVRFILVGDANKDHALGGESLAGG